MVSWGNENSRNVLQVEKPKSVEKATEIALRQEAYIANDCCLWRLVRVYSGAVSSRRSRFEAMHVHTTIT